MKMNKKFKNILFILLSVAFWVLLWHLMSTGAGRSLLLPTPAETFTVFCSLVKTPDFWLTALNSLKSIFSGAILGVILGVAIAFLSYISDFFRYLFAPLLSLVKATPVASFIILALLWIGKEYIPFAISVMMVVPIVSANVFEGLVNMDKELLEVAKLYNFSFIKKWKMLHRPSLFPYFISAAKSGLSLSWKAGIAAEVLCTPPDSIGLMLYESKLYFEFSALFAWTLTVIILSFLLEKTVLLLSEYFLGKGHLKND